MAKKKLPFARWHLLLVMLALLLVRPIIGSLFTGTNAEYSYSEFKSIVQTGAVQDVVIMDDRIGGTLHEGGSFNTVRGKQ